MTTPQTTPELLAIAREVGARLIGSPIATDFEFTAEQLAAFAKSVRVTAAPLEGVSWKMLTSDEIDEVFERPREHNAFVYQAKDLIDAFIAKNSPLPGRGMVPMTDWQPMHSAPTSRPILLLWRTAPWPLRGEWSIDEDFDTRPKGWVSPESGWRNDGDQCIPRNQEDCISWQDLPPMPGHGIKEGS